MNILFSINRAFKGLLINCLHSIQRFSGDYRVYILHSCLDDGDLEEIRASVGENVTVNSVFIGPDSLEGFPETKRYPREIYYRIFAAKLLPEDLDRILYLDADTVVINPLDTLYNMDFEDNYFIACTHTKELLTKFNQARLGAKSDAVYVNTGVMLMNLSLLRERQNPEEVFEFVKRRGAGLLLPDQDIITALYGDKIKTVDSMLYNLSDRILALYNADPRNEKRGLDWVRRNTVVIHYFGRNKPWGDKYVGILDVFYKELNK